MRLHRLDEGFRILVAVLHGGRDRHDVAIDELPDGFLNEPLIFCEIERVGHRRVDVSLPP